MSMSQTLNEKVIPVVMKFVNLKGIQALKDGVLYTMPLQIIGSLFLLIAFFPVKGFTDFMTATFGAGWTDPLLKIQGNTMNIMALVSVISIAYVYAKNEGHEPLSAGVMSLAVFLITTSDSVAFTPEGTKDVFSVGGIIPRSWIGGQGMVTAIIIGLIVGATYSWFMKKDIRIKMPEGVPSGVVSAFSALIPAAVMFTAAGVIYAALKWGGNTTFVELIYKVIQTPLQGVSDSLGGVIVIAFCIPFLWWFGVHGATIMSGIVGSLLGANMLANAELQKAGTLDLAHGAHIVTSQFYDNFINMAGSGHTLGFVLCMILFAKSAQFKQLGRLAVAPNLFNINEPILFGTPIVMNPIMAVPFIVCPVLTAILMYLAIASGLLAPMGGVTPPWTVPPIISGLLIGGLPYAFAQLVILAIDTAIYLPFFKKADAMAYADEVAAQHHADSVQA